MLNAKFKFPAKRHKALAFSLQPSAFACGGFTMVEIAISLAIIGIALIAIIGVLPIGMNTQRDNREETIINQDATMLMEAIRGGARGQSDLTNYVYAITNNWTRYNSDGTTNVGVNGYSQSGFFIAPGYVSWSALAGFALTNNLRIIGLLTTPEFTDASGAPFYNFPTVDYYSNHIVAYVRSFSGPAVEKPPQDNDIVRSDSFGYRVLCVNAPVAADTFAVTNRDVPGSVIVTNAYFKQMIANRHDLRLTFLWPQLPNGKLGPGRQTFRTQVAGQVAQFQTNGQWLYFFQPQSFTNMP